MDYFPSQAYIPSNFQTLSNPTTLKTFTHEGLKFAELIPAVEPATLLSYPGWGILPYNMSHLSIWFGLLVCL